MVRKQINESEMQGDTGEFEILFVTFGKLVFILAVLTLI